MIPKRTSSEFAGEIRRDLKKRGEWGDHSEDLLQSMTIPMCNAGLIDDIEPDGGVIIPIPPMVCGGCGSDCAEEYGPSGPCGCGTNSWRL